jgi:hypothetical protein
MQLQLAKSLQLRAQGIQKKQDAFANTMGGLARIGNLSGMLPNSGGAAPLQITAPGLAPVDTGLLSPEAISDIAMRTPRPSGNLNFDNTGASTVPSGPLNFSSTVPKQGFNAAANKSTFVRGGNFANLIKR